MNYIGMLCKPLCKSIYIQLDVIRLCNPLCRVLVQGQKTNTDGNTEQVGDATDGGWVYMLVMS